MKIIYLDESGYVDGDWKSEKNLAEQPFHVLAAVAFPVDKIPDVYLDIREKIEEINVEGLKAKELGKGLEIKARDVARGRGYWANHEEERNAVREAFLGSVGTFEGEAFITVIDKPALHAKYGTPADPTLLAAEFIYERFERYLVEEDDFGICIHDQNKINEDEVRQMLSRLNAEGSYVIAPRSLSIKHLQFKRILENVMGDSKSSLGLQIADFFATHANVYLKDGRPNDSGWWKTINSSLKADANGKVEGYGYKQFPEKEQSVFSKKG